MCIKSILRTLHCSVHNNILDKKNYDWRIGGVPGPPGPPLGYAHGHDEVRRLETKQLNGRALTVRGRTVGLLLKLKTVSPFFSLQRIPKYPANR